MKGVPGIWLSSWGYPVPWVLISPLGVEDEVGEVPGDLGFTGVIGESPSRRWDVLGIQMSLTPRLSAQQRRVPVRSSATGIWCPCCPSLPCHTAWLGWARGEGGGSPEGRGCGGAGGSKRLTTEGFKAPAPVLWGTGLWGGGVGAGGGFQEGRGPGSTGEHSGGTGWIWSREPCATRRDVVGLGITWAEWG